MLGNAAGLLLALTATSALAQSFPDTAYARVNAAGVVAGTKWLLIGGAPSLTEGDKNYDAAQNTLRSTVAVLDLETQKTSNEKTSRDTTWSVDRSQVVGQVCQYGAAAERAYCFGGQSPDGKLAPGIGVFNPATNTWEQDLDTDISPRTGHASVLVGNTIYIFGGNDSTQLTEDLQAVSLDSVTSSRVYTDGDAYPPGRVGHCMAALSDTKFLLVGGNAAGTKQLNDAWQYDADTRTWTDVSSKMQDVWPIKRTGVSCTKVGANVALFGGIGSSSRYNDIWLISNSTLQPVNALRKRNIGDFLGIPGLTARKRNAAVLARQANSGTGAGAPSGRVGAQIADLNGYLGVTGGEGAEDDATIRFFDTLSGNAGNWVASAGSLARGLVAGAASATSTARPTSTRRPSTTAAAQSSTRASAATAAPSRTTTRASAATAAPSQTTTRAFVNPDDGGGALPTSSSARSSTTTSPSVTATPVSRTMTTTTPVFSTTVTTTTSTTVSSTTTTTSARAIPTTGQNAGAVPVPVIVGFPTTAASTATSTTTSVTASSTTTTTTARAIPTAGQNAGVVPVPIIVGFSTSVASPTTTTTTASTTTTTTTSARAIPTAAQNAGAVPVPVPIIVGYPTTTTVTTSPTRTPAPADNDNDNTLLAVLLALPIALAAPLCLLCACAAARKDHRKHAFRRGYDHPNTMYGRQAAPPVQRTAEIHEHAVAAPPMAAGAVVAATVPMAVQTQTTSVTVSRTATPLRHTQAPGTPHRSDSRRRVHSPTAAATAAGAAPSLLAIEEGAQQATTLATQQPGRRTSRGKRYRVLWASTPSQLDEVDAAAGDIVEEKRVFADGWALVHNVTKGATGMIPINILEEIPAETTS